MKSHIFVTTRADLAAERVAADREWMAKIQPSINALLEFYAGDFEKHATVEQKACKKAERTLNQK